MFFLYDLLERQRDTERLLSSGYLETHEAILSFNHVLCNKTYSSHATETAPRSTPAAITLLKHSVVQLFRFHANTIPSYFTMSRLSPLTHCPLRSSTFSQRASLLS